MTKVMVFGTFSILHPGHMNLFRQAKQYGDELVVVLARSKNVEQYKQYKPLSAQERKNELLRIPYVTKVVFGTIDGDKMQVVRDEQPDVICLGYDQTFFIDELKRMIRKEHLDIKLIRLKPYHPQRYKSSFFRDG